MEFTYALLDTGLRGAAGTLMLLTLFIIARDAGRTLIGRLGIAFLICAISYVLTSAPWAGTLPLGVHIPLVILSLVTPLPFWMFGRALFQDEYRPGWLEAGLFAGLVTLGLIRFLTYPSLVEWLSELMMIIPQLVKIAMVAHVMVLALQGRDDDLLEQRRRFRLGFVATISVFFGIVLVAEFILPATGPSIQLSALNMAGLTVVGFVTLAHAVKLRSADLVTSLIPDVAPSARAPEADTQDRPVMEKLVRLMEHDQVWLEDGLTIGGLAKQVGVQEYRLRRVINQQLGFRNFSSFLNSYRLAEAQAQLSDPGRAHLPVLTIALNLGWASIGPFNRAFKDETGQTPTEFRRAHLGPKPAK